MLKRLGNSSNLEIKMRNKYLAIIVFQINVSINQHIGHIEPGVQINLKEKQFSNLRHGSLGKPKLQTKEVPLHLVAACDLQSGHKEVHCPVPIAILKKNGSPGCLVNFSFTEVKLVKTSYVKIEEFNINCEELETNLEMEVRVT